MGRSNPNKDRTSGSPNLNDQERKVNIAYRFVGGPEWAKGAKVVDDIADVTLGLFMPGKFLFDLISKKEEPMPNPNYHCGKLLRNWYENDHFDKEGGSWDTFEVGTTRYNDAAINSAGIQAMDSMPEDYDFWSNNCQTFTIRLADMICRNGRKKVYTSWSRWTLTAGFIPGMESADQATDQKQELEVSFVENGAKHFAMLENIEEILQRNTPEVTAKQLVEEIEASKEGAKTDEAS